MTYRDILKTAVGMVGEEIGAFDNLDYEEGAPYLLSAFCRECAEYDRRYRFAHGDETRALIPKVACVEMEDSFPLVDALAAPAAYYLASVLTIDENETLSDRYFSRYTDALAELLATLPFASAPTTDRYGVLV